MSSVGAGGARPARVPPSVFAAVGYFLPRLLFLNTRWAPQVHWGDIAWALDGFPEADLDLGSPRFWSEWSRRWVRRARGHLQLAAQSSTAAGRARAYRTAAACFHWAEFMDFDDAAAKTQLRQQVRECFTRSLEDGGIEIVRGQLPSDESGSVAVPYQLVLPPDEFRAPGPMACVVISNGLDSMTEVEPLSLAESYLERGIAALLFDGPGQGIQLGQTPLRLDMENVVAQLANVLHDDDRIADDQLAFLGVSFGGYFALRVAQKLSDLFRCVVNLSGGPRIAAFDGLPRRLKDDFRFAFSGGTTTSSSEVMQSVFDALQIQPRTPAVTDVLSIHGALDDIFPVRYLYELDKTWGRRHELVVLEREAHVCLNEIDSCAVLAADWVASRLASGHPRNALAAATFEELSWR